MSARDVDAVVLGGGVNGLVAATWLARRGLAVRLFERAPELGGLAAGRELHPDYRTNGTLVETEHFPVELAAELELERHGLRRREREASLHVVSGAGELFELPAETGAACVAIRRSSDRDADAYARWREQLARWTPFVARVLNDPPPDLDAENLRGNLALFGAGLALRRLGQRDMLALLRSAPLSLSDWLGETFESEALRVALAGPALEGAFFGPRGAGGAALLLAREARRGPSVAGGAGALVAALVGAARAAGVALETGREVARVELGAHGVSTVVLADGERVACGALLASASPKQALLELLPPTALAPSLADAARSMRARGTTAVLDVALDAPFELRGAGPVERCVTAGSLEALERASDAPKYGACAERPWLAIAVPSVETPELCPAGSAVLTIRVHTAPHALRGGWTDPARASLQARALEELFRVSPDARTHVVATRLRTPLELEAEFRLPGGHLHHLELALDQLLVSRPSAVCAHYATPLEGLFLGGRGSHPGGSTSGVEGWLAARALFERARRARRARPVRS